MYDENLPRQLLKFGKILELHKSTELKVRGTKIKVGKAGTLIDRPVNKLLTIEVNSEQVSAEAVSDNDNVGMTKSRPNREAALKNEIKCNHIWAQ